MSKIFAYECYADQDVFVFLRDHCKLPIERLHSYSQGEVINDLLKRKRAEIGLVDEDPHSTHHKGRDQMPVLRESTDLEVRQHEGRHLIIVKPELEECFLRSMKRLNLSSGLAQQAKDLQRVLNNKDNPRHQVFREELGQLYQRSKAQKVQTFITELEEVIRPLV